MAGTRAGGLKAAATNKARHGEDFYVKIGGQGGANGSVGKGFSAHPELARTAGAKGGRISRRIKSTNQGEAWQNPSSNERNLTTKDLIATESLKSKEPKTQRRRLFGFLARRRP